MTIDDAQDEFHTAMNELREAIPQPVEDREIVAIRTKEVGGHEHITAVKLATGYIESADDVLKAINNHQAHYVMAHESGLPMIVQTRLCPDCNEPVIWA